jgi:hypothetical protein
MRSHILPSHGHSLHHTAILWTRLTECRRLVDPTDSRPSPSDDIGPKRETPMNSTPTPKAIKPHNTPIARADEQLAHAHEQIARAGEDLARLSEQLAKMERDATRPASAGSGSQSPPGKPALRALVGLPLAACIVVAALVLQSSYGGGAKVDVARRAPELASTPSCRRKTRRFPRSPLQLSFNWPRRRQHHRKQRPWLRPHRKTPRRQLPQRLPIRHSCCKRWRAISRIWSKTSNSSRRTSNKYPATIQKPLRSSRRARKR